MLIVSVLMDYLGILDYHGVNWISVEIWAQQESGAKLANFTLTAGVPILTSLKTPRMAPVPSFTARSRSY
jgi:beta-galactosidase